jgi:hypothetical protein
MGGCEREEAGAGAGARAEVEVEPGQKEMMPGAMRVGRQKVDMRKWFKEQKAARRRAV